jgi:hypothetical protein
MKYSQGVCGDGAAILQDGLPLTPQQIIAKLNRFESFSEEMVRHRDELARLSAEFLKLDAFDDAAKCAIKAEGLKFVIGRMPKS